jgi:hypothetical protein
MLEHEIRGILPVNPSGGKMAGAKRSVRSSKRQRLPTASGLRAVAE